MEIPTISPEYIKATITGADSTKARVLSADEIDPTFKSQYTDLISAPLGSRILSFSDEWFAAASNLTTPTPPIRRPGVFTHAGAWYDGWETRRHNTEPADWVVFRLGVASGKVIGAEIDTAFFNGNHAPEIAIEGTFASDDQEDEVKKPGYTGWETILSKQECGPSQRHGWILNQLTEKAYTHVRLLMYPDGGIARFRLYGNAVPVFPQSIDEVFELSATVNGGVATSCSDQHFGTKDNLLLPGRGKDMGDGWETKRTRGVHIDWTIVRLGAKGEIDNIVIDTAHFRGNFPQKVQVYAGEFEKDPGHEDKGWVEVLSPQKSGPDKEHVYGQEVLTDVKGKKYTHAKLIIIPDGGVKRFRVFGKRVV
ncbi:Allantoicase [Aaosphaeria arxii CBS 175.79]|uniref:allantoicase n=1 Tax=Aaosphaeria arxii CBS 175.79 TaxID=1450172 RepID=A0A6A5XGN5_9PLEO|nr:Allantoicase [Aaosphaeria arxii CBS 175.79]KAF2012348.1 Allantoicase [Aaosphaeria arxii CBS 175.79]